MSQSSPIPHHHSIGQALAIVQASVRLKCPRAAQQSILEPVAEFAKKMLPLPSMGNALPAQLTEPRHAHGGGSEAQRAGPASQYRPDGQLLLRHCILAHPKVKKSPSLAGRYVVEIVLPKLQVEKYAVGELAKQLQPGSAQAGVKSLIFGSAKNRGSGIALVPAHPRLVDKSEFDKVAAGFVEPELNPIFWD